MDGLNIGGGVHDNWSGSGREYAAPDDWAGRKMQHLCTCVCSTPASLSIVVSGMTSYFAAFNASSYQRNKVWDIQYEERMKRFDKDVESADSFQAHAIDLVPLLFGVCGCV